MADRAIVGLVLAAGKGTRFQTEQGPALPKVLRPVLDRPMVCHVLRTLRGAGVEDVVIIVGFGADQVRETLGDYYSYVLQPEQKGSGHAVSCAREHFQDSDGTLVVMCGDSPLFRPETLRAMVARHVETGAAVTLASATIDNPTGYGRIVRSSEHADQPTHAEPAEARIIGVVEEKCASERKRAIREVNGGAYVFDIKWLFDNIGQMAENAAGEYNLTDMVRVAVEQGRAVESAPCSAEEIAGVNTPEELAAVEQVLRGRGIG